MAVFAAKHSGEALAEDVLRRKPDGVSRRKHLMTKRIGLSIALIAVLAVLVRDVRGWIDISEKQQQRQEWAENVRTSKMSTYQLERQLRAANAFGHVTESRAFGCEFIGRPPGEPQGWDYMCHLYWGTQPGVAQSTHQMKFGAMVDSSQITRLSDLVPVHGPLPQVHAYSDLVLHNGQQSRDPPAQSGKMNAADLEGKLIDARVVAQDTGLHCTRAASDWDYVCSYMPTTLQSKAAVKFGVIVDEKRWLQISRTTPAAATLPPPSPTR